MEHSEEYYKMKYFKYKAKYILEKQRLEQSGKGVVQGLGKMGEGLVDIGKGIGKGIGMVTPTIFRGDAKKEAFKNALNFYVKRKQIDTNKTIDMLAETKIWNGVTSYQVFLSKFGEIEVNLNADEKKQLKEIKENLYKWCKNTVFLSNEIDAKCKA